jgi:hypothetical protein
MQRRIGLRRGMDRFRTSPSGLGSRRDEGSRGVSRDLGHSGRSVLDNLLANFPTSRSLATAGQPLFSSTVYSTKEVAEVQGARKFIYSGYDRVFGAARVWRASVCDRWLFPVKWCKDLGRWLLTYDSRPPAMPRLRVRLPFAIAATAYCSTTPLECRVVAPPAE